MPFLALTALSVLSVLPAPPGRIDPAPLSCITMNTEKLPLATRKSPLDSLSFKVGSSDVKVCYGRPSLRGRHMLGGDDVPYGKLWRTGANEPTMIHTSGPLVVAGIKVPAGSYSLYTVPTANEWEVIVNKSITQWGEEQLHRRGQGPGTRPRQGEARGAEDPGRAVYHQIGNGLSGVGVGDDEGEDSGDRGELRAVRSEE